MGSIEEKRMLKKSSSIVTFSLVAILLLTACEASAGPDPFTTPTVNNPLLLNTATGMPLVSQYGTQTALAAGGLPSSTPDLTQTTPAATATNTPGLFTQVPPTGVATNTGAPGITPVVTVATVTPGRPATYTLQAGEHPYCLARRFNVDPQALLDLNNLQEGDVLQPGLQLKIPQSGSYPGTRALHTHPAQYTVTSQDTIYRIACYYGDVDPSQIAAANSLTPPYTLTPGRILNIP
jgi:LysM repeat protein